MTKDEACEAIKRLSSEACIHSWAEFKRRCREILDQIDPATGEFTVREMCELMGNTSGQCEYIHMYNEGSFDIGVKNSSDILVMSPDELKAKLIELATPPTPPKPKTVMVELPTADAAYIADRSSIQCGSLRMISDACRAALAKLEQ